jgi:hypothetical protein
VRTWTVTATFRIEVDDPPAADDARAKVRWIRPYMRLRRKLLRLMVWDPRVSVERIDFNPNLTKKETERWITR